MQADFPSKPTVAPATPNDAGSGAAQPGPGLPGGALPGGSVGGLPKDLMPRIASGVVLAGVALALLYAGVRPFTGLVLVVALAMCWEWGSIVRKTDIDTPCVVHGTAVGVGVVLAGCGFAALGLLIVVIGALIVLALRFGERTRLSAVGVLYVGLPCIGLLWLRGDEPYGFRAVLFLLLAVIVTDTAAYAVGRTVGGPKLWPRISPNKTWSGLIGGVTAAGLAGALFALTIPGGSAGLLGLTGIVCGLLTQAGDLAESALKRAYGVKDASQLIPGHGGFMDRMDGLVGAAVAAALFALSLNMHAPARALLMWH
jgi:phosphatidate cytidylyltransferase